MVIRNTQQQHQVNSHGFHTYHSSASATATDRIRCSMGEWKQRNQFSNQSLKTYDFMTKGGQATAKDSLVTCREHTTSGQRTELLCQGPCGRVRSATDFSKNSKRKKKLWCKDCTDWYTADPDQNLPPPGTEPSVDELTEFKMEPEVQTNTSEPTDDQPTTTPPTNNDSEGEDDDDELTAGYWSDDGQDTIYNGLRSTNTQTTTRHSELPSIYIHRAQSQTASSASQPETDPEELAAVTISTKATNNTTRESAGSKGWVKGRKPKTFEIPNYIRRGVPEEQENRRLRGEESDDSF